MKTKICEYCKQEFAPKRSDARFCSSTCKSKYWYEYKNSEVIPDKSTLQSTLKGVISENTEVNEPPVKAENYTIIKRITNEYISLKNKLDALCKERDNFERRIKSTQKEIESIRNNNGENFEYFTTVSTAILIDPSFKKPVKNILGGAGGYFGAKCINALFRDDREKRKALQIANKSAELARLNVYYSSLCGEIKKSEENISSIDKFESVSVPFKPILNQDLVKDLMKKTEDKRVLTDNSKETPALHVNYTNNQPAVSSEKIITSCDLAKYNYNALNFTGKWYELFGLPATQFQCVIHGKPGEGKSTFAVLFAQYLAENFGNVIYISGEEGFSKTLKDKFVNNNALSENLHVADLCNYDDIIKEVPKDYYHFIFIDSLNNMRIDAEKLKLLKERYKESAFITICQATKDGKMRGSLEIIHDVDIEVVVSNGLATTNKNRFKEKGKEFKVF